MDRYQVVEYHRLSVAGRCMSMDTHTIRIPLRLIEKRYGSRSEMDSAGDDVLEVVNLVSDYDSQYRVTFDVDFSHDNPWYHAMTCTIERITPDAYRRLCDLLEQKGLLG